MGGVDYIIFYNTLSDIVKTIINDIFDSAIILRKKLYDLLSKDKYGIHTEKSLREAVNDIILPPTIKQNIIRDMRNIHVNSKYDDIIEAVLSNNINLNEEPILVWNANRWRIEKNRPILKLGEECLKKYHVYEIELPIKLPSDTETTGPFKISIVYDDELDISFLKCYYRSFLRSSEEIEYINDDFDDIKKYINSNNFTNSINRIEVKTNDDR